MRISRGIDPLVEALAARSASLPLLEDARGVWTRGELRDAVSRARAHLRKRGVQEGDRVVVIATPGDKRVVGALLGVRSAGALACPLDPREADPDIQRIRPRLVVGPVATSDGGATFDDLLSEPGDHGDYGAASASSAAAWGVPTSGSSGRKRTVVLTPASVAFVTEAIQETVRYVERDRVHGGLPLHHTYGLSQLWLALHSGACLVLPEGQPTASGLASWLRGATVLPTISSKLKLLLDVGYKPDARLITLAGQGADAETRRRFAAAAPDSRFVLFYGLTEATTRVLWLDHDEFLENPRGTGRPLGGIRVWLDEEGELWVEGPNVAAGYLDDPETTAHRFPEGKLRTGDYFDMDGDVYCYRGRMDGVFKRAGEKVVPELVEAALETHPSVERCLVTSSVGRDGEAVPVAWVVAREPVEARTLIQHARTRVSAVMVPAKIEFVTSLATTANGKLVRKPPA